MSSIDFLERDRARIESRALPPSLYALFAETASRCPTDPFWITVDGEGSTLSYAEFDARVRRCAASLRRFGIGGGTHVAVVMHNSPELGTTWLALSLLGAVAIGVNAGLTASELNYILRSSEAEVVIADRDALPLLEARSLSARPRMLLRGQVAPGEHAWDEVMQADAARLEPRSVDPDEMASMLFTSGSTGFPKPCMLPHRWHTMIGWVRSQQGPPVRRILIDTPLYYMGGQWRFAMAMFLGAAVCVARKPSLSRYLDRLQEYEIEFCSASELTAKLADDPRYGSISIVWACSTGLSGELQPALETRLGAPVREIYGSTELGSTIVMPTAVTDMVGSGSCGAPSAWRRCKIVGEQAQELPPGRSGELWVQGPGTLLGYYGRPDANAESFVDGWFRTGDLFTRDADGFYYWQGRIKNIIRRSNQNISADEVEAAVRVLPEVAEAAVIPVADAYRGEEVKLYVRLKPGLSASDISPQRLVDRCREVLAPYKVPRYLEYIDAFPRTASNKVSRQALKAAKPDLRAGSFDVQDGLWR